MLSANRVAISLARSKRSGSTSRAGTASTGVMLAASVSGLGTAIRSLVLRARGRVVRPWLRIRPTRRLRSGRLGQRLGARDDLEDLLRDLRLARTVHAQRERVDELARILGGVPHRGHPRALLGGGGLEERPIYLRLDVDREQPLHDLLGLGLEDEVATERVRRALLLVRLEDLGRDGKHVLLGHPLGERRDVRVV